MSPPSPEAPLIHLHADVRTLFEQTLDAAALGRETGASPAARTYLVGLLTDYARAERLAEAGLDRPLTLQLAEAERWRGPERFERLRTLGDAVLYVSGFFGVHLRQRGVEEGYVASLGARAYQGALAMLGTGDRGAGAADVLAELAGRFRDFSRLLGEVADRLLFAGAGGDRQLVRLYERWLATGSAALADALVGRGVLPVRAAAC